MATATTETQCSICGKETITFNCKGCSQQFCQNDSTKYLQKLTEDLNKIENDYDQLRQIFNEKKDDQEKHSLINEINKWEEDSINKIKQTAEECKNILNNYTNKVFIKIENKLNDIDKKVKEIRQGNEFNEIDLNEFKEKLNKLKEELDKPSNVSIEQQSSSFINKIFVVIAIDKDTTWKQEGITIAGGNGRGNQLNQFDYPYGIFIDDDQTIYIADCFNHRIVEWKYNTTNGKIVAGGNGEGNKTNQLNRPMNMIIDKENNSLIICDFENSRIMQWSRQNNTTNGEILMEDIICCDLAIDKDGSLYIPDHKNNEVRRWKRGEQHGTIVAGGNGKGDHFNQLNGPTYIFIDEDYSLYVSDLNNHRVMKWLKDAKEGIVVSGGNGDGDSLTQLFAPQGVIVDQFSQIYVADSANDRVMRWCKGAKEGTIVVGGNGFGEQSNQLYCPSGLSFDRQGNLYVSDCNNIEYKNLK